MDLLSSVQGKLFKRLTEAEISLIRYFDTWYSTIIEQIDISNTIG